MFKFTYYAVSVDSELAAILASSELNLRLIHQRNERSSSRIRDRVNFVVADKYDSSSEEVEALATRYQNAMSNRSRACILALIVVQGSGPCSNRSSISGHVSMLRPRSPFRFGAQ